jgi:hypothetical protein
VTDGGKLPKGQVMCEYYWLSVLMYTPSMSVMSFLLWKRKMLLSFISFPKKNFCPFGFFTTPCSGEKKPTFSKHARHNSHHDGVFFLKMRLGHSKFLQWRDIFLQRNVFPCMCRGEIVKGSNNDTLCLTSTPTWVQCNILDTSQAQCGHQCT